LGSKRQRTAILAGGVSTLAARGPAFAGQSPNRSPPPVQDPRASDYQRTGIQVVGNPWFRHPLDEPGFENELCIVLEPNGPGRPHRHSGRGAIMRRRTPDGIKERIVASSRHTVRSQPAHGVAIADAGGDRNRPRGRKSMHRSPAPVSNDRGCPGLLFEDLGFAVDSLPAKAGIRIRISSAGVTINPCWRESKSDPVWSPL
jgi:hypothetical protein